LFSNSCPFTTAGKHRGIELDVQECNQLAFLVSQTASWSTACSSVNRKEKAGTQKSVNDKLYSQSKSQ